MNKRQEEYEKHAINLLRNSSEGVLSTISVRNEGYPFGSFVTYITDVDRSVIIYASNIAQHTINLKENSKSCLTLFKIDDDLDKQNSSRMTLLGDLQSMPEKEIDETRARFEEFLPESKKYAAMHDFNFYRLHIDQIRWIGGFGKIAWLDNKDWKQFKPKWMSNQTSIIDHMNKDHTKNISASLNAQHNVQDPEAKMFALSIDGYFVKSEDKIYFISFERVCKNAKDYKDILVEQANQYRSYEI
jgi:putative heme iron utilization protein